MKVTINNSFGMMFECQVVGDRGFKWGNAFL
jgi:hypothetical protein